MAEEFEKILGADNGNPPDSLRQMYPKVNRNFDRVKAWFTSTLSLINGHIQSVAAHLAEHITYSGSAPGNTVKQGIDNTYNRISEIVAQAGDDNTEIVDARNGFTTLGDRLNNSDAQLADKAPLVHTSLKATDTILGHVRVDGTTITVDGSGVISSVGGGQSITTGTLNYYISPTGNDDNDGLSLETPFKTLQRAVNLTPKIIDHYVTYNLAPGTYSGTTTLEGFSGRRFITIRGNASTPSNYIITSPITITGCESIVLVGFVMNVSSAHGINITRSNVDISACSISGAGLYGVSADRSSVNMQTTAISNKTSAAIRAINLSTIFSNTNNGSGNALSLYAEGGSTIIKFGLQPSGTTAEQVVTGGLIR
ncbi:hypothetical protein J41TS12_17350 [Paenibacillus antibioticophila]|uniref:Uncharacterized protein n=1 Tax=Paenibacillus antibioticophila TaxID=1274374 RepID=A0A919XQ05_9BACL|nr:hypothetical protein [Paenibacillus antibioticophila]GIO36874.1 hypothetical protein J41TS12_17350 [Paenibacillus antibioticophila]